MIGGIQNAYKQVSLGRTRRVTNKVLWFSNNENAEFNRLDIYIVLVIGGRQICIERSVFG